MAVLLRSTSTATLAGRVGLFGKNVEGVFGVAIEACGSHSLLLPAANVLS